MNGAHLEAGTRGAPDVTGRVAVVWGIGKDGQLGLGEGRHNFKCTTPRKIPIEVDDEGVFETTPEDDDSHHIVQV